MKIATMYVDAIAITQCEDCLPEHQSITFEIGGVSRACVNQLERHRMASYSQESMRYVTMNESSVVMPPHIGEDAKEIMMSGYAATLETYKALRGAGLRKEDARFVLGLGTATRLVVTMQLPWLKRFWQLRHSKAAQWEIRELANEMILIASEFFPNYFRRETNKILDER